MTALNRIPEYFLSVKPFVMLSIIIIIMAVIFRIRLATAIKPSLSLGIGFIGIFIAFDYLVGSSNLPVPDTAWSPPAVLINHGPAKPG